MLLVRIHLHNINIYRQTNQLKIDFLGFFLFLVFLFTITIDDCFLSKVINDDNVVAVDNVAQLTIGYDVFIVVVVVVIECDIDTIDIFY